MDYLPILALSEAAGKLVGAGASLILGFVVDSPKLACVCFVTAAVLSLFAIAELV